MESAQNGTSKYDSDLLQPTRERDAAIDFLKGIAIYLVVLGHINPPERVVDLIYSFHMPLFMFLSGCTFWYSYQKRLMTQSSWTVPLKYTLTRSRNLLLPYVMWSIIRNIIYNRSFNPIGAVINSFDTLWFLPTLLVIIAIAAIAEFAACKAKISGGGADGILWEVIVVAISGVLLLGLMLCTGAKIYRQVLIYFIPFAVGVAVKKYSAMFRIYMGQTMTTLCIIVSACLLPFYSKQEGSVSVLAIRFITGITLTQVIYHYVEQIDFSKGNRLLCLLSYLGRHTLEIYIISEFFRPLFTNRLAIGTFQEALLRMGYAAIICIIVLLISSIIRQSDLLTFCLLGEKRSKVKMM